MHASTHMSNGKRIVSIAIAAVIAASFAVPASAGHKVRYGAPARPAGCAGGRQIVWRG